MIPLQDSVREKFESADAAFVARPFREKLMIAAMAIGLVFFAIDLIAIQPITDDRNRIEIGADRTRETQSMKEAQLAALSSGEMSAEERRIFDETELVRTQISEIDRRMASEIEGLVPPQAIVAVLEELLEKTPGLRLVRRESEPPYQIGSKASADEMNGSTSTASDTSQPGDEIEKLYRHGVRIQIEGDFHSTLEYLQRVKSSEWHLMWDALDYRVESHPTAIITIDFHTISQSEEWIGV